MDASVIMPVLNEGERLRRAVRAVAAQRCEGDFEILVVDGGSEDGCLADVEELGARVVEAPGTTAGAARNVGARRARGRVLAFTDADCIPLPGWLQGMVAALDARPGLAGVGGGLRHLPRGPPGRFEDLDSRLFYRGMITSNVAYRPGPFWAAGGFDPRLRCAEDWDLAWRLQELGHRIAYCPEALVVHDPSENAGYASFLRKQWWYARCDMPALLPAALAVGRGSGRGRRGAREHLATAALHAAGAGLLASVALAPVGLALIGAWALRRTFRAARALPPARPQALGYFAHEVAKGLVRGFGAWAGLADALRRPRRWALRVDGGLPVPVEPPEPPRATAAAARVR